MIGAVAYIVLLFCSVPEVNLTIPIFILSKIYANSLLAVFNSRLHIIRGRIQSPELTNSLKFAKVTTNSGIISDEGMRSSQVVGVHMVS